MTGARPRLVTALGSTVVTALAPSIATTAGQSPDTVPFSAFYAVKQELARVRASRRAAEEKAERLGAVLMVSLNAHCVMAAHNRNPLAALGYQTPADFVAAIYGMGAPEIADLVKRFARAVEDEK